MNATIKQLVEQYVSFWDKLLISSKAVGSFIHPCDEKELTPNGVINRNICFTTSQIIQYDKKKDGEKIHIDLLPLPYMGDILNARIYIIMNNPGIGEKKISNKTRDSDHRVLGEYEDIDNKNGLWDALVANLRQDFSNPLLNEYKFSFLNPLFCDTAGGRYISAKMSKSIDFYCDLMEVDSCIGKKAYANNICFLQHYPYHCGLNPAKFQKSLCSHQTMQKFYKDFLPEISKQEDRLVIVVRGSKLIRDFTNKTKVIDYACFSRGAQSRAHFSISSDGNVGVKIAQHLKKFA